MKSSFVHQSQQEKNHPYLLATFRWWNFFPVMDFDNESLLRCFCSEEEEATIIAWNKENEHSRSDIFEYSPLEKRMNKTWQVEENGDQGTQWGKTVVFGSEDGLPPRKNTRLKQDLLMEAGVLTKGKQVVVVFFGCPLSFYIFSFVGSWDKEIHHMFNLRTGGGW